MKVEKEQTGADLEDHNIIIWRSWSWCMLLTSSKCLFCRAHWLFAVKKHRLQHFLWMKQDDFCIQCEHTFSIENVWMFTMSFLCLFIFIYFFGYICANSILAKMPIWLYCELPIFFEQLCFSCVNDWAW